MNKFLTLSFLPTNRDVALLLLRLGFGGYMIAAHGMPKLLSFAKRKDSFPDPLGLSSPVSLGFTVGAEVIAAAFLVLGLFTRLSAAALIFTMGVAFFTIHSGIFIGEGNGELAMVYLLAYLVIFVAGAGKYSIDGKLGA
ncbi:MAG: DoxX family protein [Synoicihabitans sp.]